MQEPERHYLNLWVETEGLAAEATRAATLELVAGWIRQGDAARVRDAALVVSWWADRDLEPLVEPLGARAQKDMSSVVKLWVAHALHALAVAKVNIEGAFSALFGLIEQRDGGGDQFVAASFAIESAQRQGASFAHVVDEVARTLSVRSASAEIYGALLASGFVPPPRHKRPVLDLLGAWDESSRLTARQGLVALLAQGEDISEAVAELAERLRAKTAKDLERPLRAVAELAAGGVPLTPFFALLERALASKTMAVRQAAHRAFSRIAETATAAALARDERAARAGGFEKVASLLARGVIPKPVRPSRPPAAAAAPLVLAELEGQLRSDALIDVQTAVGRIRRANRDELKALVPALLDAVATEERTRALEHLGRALTFRDAEAIDLRKAIPVVAGLLLDRDYYNALSLDAILNFLIAALDAEYDIRLAWPWVPSYLDGAQCDDLRFVLAKKIVSGGLTTSGLAAWEPWLRAKLVDISPEGHPSGILKNMRYVGAAAECLIRAQRNEGAA